MEAQSRHQLRPPSTDKVTGRLCIALPIPSPAFYSGQCLPVPEDDRHIVPCALPTAIRRVVPGGAAVVERAPLPRGILDGGGHRGNGRRRKDGRGRPSRRPRRPHEAKTLLKGQFNESSPRVSPDGRLLAFVSDETSRSEVYVQSFPEPGGKVQVSLGGRVQPVWRPGMRGQCEAMSQLLAPPPLGGFVDGRREVQ